MLSRDNITSNALKREFNSAIPLVNLVTTFSNTDSDSDRRGVTISCIKSVELAKQKRFKEAIKEMERVFFSVKDRYLRKKISFGQLAFLLSKYEEYKKEKLLEFCILVKARVRPDLSKLTRGAAFDFCNII
jgi:DNA helicase-2/ATP-dependent DNA helicase PcrA